MMILNRMAATRWALLCVCALAGLVPAEMSWAADFTECFELASPGGSADGNGFYSWNDAANWDATTCNSTYPRNNGADRYAVQIKSHKLKIPTGVSVTLGTSPTAQPLNGAATGCIVNDATDPCALRVGNGNIAATNTAIFKIETGATFVARGETLVENGTAARSGIVMEGTGIFEIDGSQNVGQTYMIALGNSNGTITNIVATGSAGNPCQIRSNSGGSYGNMVHTNYTGSGQYLITDCRLIRMGTNVKAALSPSLHSIATSAATLTRVSLETTGGISNLSGSSGAQTVTMTDVVFTQTTGWYCLSGTGVSTTLSTGARGLTRVSCDRDARLWWNTGGTETGNYWDNSIDLSITSGVTATITGNVYRRTSGSETTISATGCHPFQNSLLFNENPANGDLHAIGYLGSTPACAGNVDISGNYFLHGTTLDDNANGILTTGHATVVTNLDIHHNVVLPAIYESTLGSYNLVHHYASLRTIVVAAWNNTSREVGDGPAMFYYNSLAARWAGIYNNLAYSTSSPAVRYKLTFPTKTAGSTSFATPIVMTLASHALVTGDSIVIAGHSHAAANGTWTVTVLTSSTFSLDGSVGTTTGTGGTIISNCQSVLTGTVHHNAGFGLAAGAGGGYNTVLPAGCAAGANDVDGIDPVWQYPNRTLYTWYTDSAGLNQTVTDAWSAATTYAIGNVTTRTVVGFNGGQPAAFAATIAHNGTTNPECAPGGALLVPRTTTILSSTNATPVQITLSAAPASPLQTGQRITISGHITNTTANGVWTVTRVTDTVFTLDGSTGTAAGGATGLVVADWHGCWEAASLTELRKYAGRNVPWAVPSYNSSASLPNLLTYLAGSVTPTATAYHADSVGGWIGAVEGLAGEAAPAPISGSGGSSVIGIGISYTHSEAQKNGTRLGVRCSGVGPMLRGCRQVPN